jgi:hypothetical protein
VVALDSDFLGRYVGFITCYRVKSVDLDSNSAMEDAMSETWIGTIPAFGMILIIFGSWLYMMGGRNGKWKRRFLGSLLVSGSIWLVSGLLGNFSWWLLAIYPLCVGSFVLGYGSDTLGGKLRKRGTVVAASLMSGVLLALVFHAWAVFPIELAMASLSIYLGVRNPIQAAPEEFFVCMCLWMPKLMYAFV